MVTKIQQVSNVYSGDVQPIYVSIFRLSLDCSYWTRNLNQSENLVKPSKIQMQKPDFVGIIGLTDR